MALLCLRHPSSGARDPRDSPARAGVQRRRAGIPGCAGPQSAWSRTLALPMPAQIRVLARRQTSQRNDQGAFAITEWLLARGDELLERVVHRCKAGHAALEVEQLRLE